MTNQNPEQIARDAIDKQLLACGWIIQNKTQINLAAGTGVAVREYQTNAGPADYVLFVQQQPVGIIEAKRPEMGQTLSVVEEQGEEYAKAKLKFLNNDPLPYVYVSTGAITKFTNYNDPKPRSREVFSFHRPETLLRWVKEGKTLRGRLLDLPELPLANLRDCQIDAINNLEKSFKNFKPKALVQMATGSGKTFTAITFIYRLLKFAKAKRVLFLVDTKNLGEQAEQEFMVYQPTDSNSLFPQLHNVTRLRSSFIPDDSEVYISTIQRMYSILKGTELEESAEELNPYEFVQTKEPMPVVYNERVPVEFFDFIVIDECHRSIYNLWRQVLDYFDAFQVGLTATPDNRTFSYFNGNVVSDYGYEKAVIDGVLVPYNVFTIETKITKEGAAIALGEKVDKRERLTRRKFWETVDEDIAYSGKQLDKDIVNPSTIRSIIRATRDNLPVMFPDRFDKDGHFEVPKMLIFAKSDSHAEDIIEIVREEFGEANKFCRKITYQSKEDPKSILSEFRNSYYPRIAVTVDMIATGTDIRPLEVLLFMRDVKSKSYYEQMKGRGTRTCTLDELRKTGTPTAKYNKDHFVIIDAIGVESSQKTDSRPLEKQPGMSLKDVLQTVAMGNRSEEILTTLANRLIRLDRQINPKEREKFSALANGLEVKQVVQKLLNAYDPDTIEQIRTSVYEQHKGEAPTVLEAKIEEQHRALIDKAITEFHNPELRNYIVDVRKKYDQIIDTLNIDEVHKIGWVADVNEQAQSSVAAFEQWVQENKDEALALQIFYGEPYRRRELTYKMIRDLYDKLILEQPTLQPAKLWDAYATMEDEQDKGKFVQRMPRSEKPKQDLVLLVSVLRKALRIDEYLNGYDKTVDRNFQDWAFKKQAGANIKFTEEQMQWLRMIKDYIANSFHLDTEDFELNPFNAHGGLGKFYQLFGNQYIEIIDELNEVLAA
ncbi:type I modification methyltransferase, subunit R [Flavobacterium cauense R2A-7]|nr:DEAD/DEAH box helicase family protein [Flavobacterium cauense]ESU19036.1 type I modification methyltransferase, subunit R [Flavobacterium cauense R2A-7]KGO82333.1 restriction endonuclease subunit R [Flavobacterium cauense R2A-7]